MTTPWEQRVTRLAAAFLVKNRQAAYGDPYWLTAKYPGRAKDGTPVKKGDKVLYWPRTKEMLVGPKAEQAWRDFQAQVSDEDAYNYRAASAVIVGDIFYSSWGYDQTNVDFYQVVKVGPAMISMRKVHSKVVSRRGEPQEYVEPVSNSFTGPVFNKKLNTSYDGRPMVKIESYAHAYKWDGKPKAQTGSGWGH